MITKSLVKKMVYPEVQKYIEKHPEYRLPTLTEAYYVYSDNPSFWILDTIGDRNAVYHKDTKKAYPSHWNFKQLVTLIKEQK